MVHVELLELSLVDYLGWKMGCEILSDLPRNPRRGKLRYIVEKVPGQAFPLSDWLDAISYLTPETAAFCETQESARQRLIQAL